MADLKKEIDKAALEEKLQFLKAADMFADDLTQVFSARTGKYLGTLKDGQEVIFNEQGEAEIKPDEETNPNQLALF